MDVFTQYPGLPGQIRTTIYHQLPTTFVQRVVPLTSRPAYRANSSEYPDGSRCQPTLVVYKPSCSAFVYLQT
jgi:hypothetical protein